jgi:hypothetical protein
MEEGEDGLTVIFLLTKERIVKYDFQTVGKVNYPHQLELIDNLNYEL